jgi:C4-dicarboxylate transporter DctM subunit
MSVAITHTFGGMDSFPMMALPFFILAGEIMGKAGIVAQIVNFANSIVGSLRGGLGHVNIVGSMIFAGISGSGVADASAIGSITIPAMTKQGYGKDVAVAINSCAATIGPIIPPSIPMIIWGTLTGESIGALFLGGLIPGLLIGFGLMAMNYIVCRKRGYDFRGEHFNVKNMLLNFYRSIGALIMPIIIVGGIVSGIFTATEAGIVAVMYGFFFGTLISRTLKLRDLPSLLINSAVTTGIVMYIIALSSVFAHLLSRLQFQETFLTYILGIAGGSATMVVVYIIILLLLLGIPIEPPPIIIMFAPTLAEVGNKLGYHPIHFGVLMVIVILIGAVTPPVGGMLFVSLGIAKLPLDKVGSVLWPFIAVLVAVCIIILFVPQTVTWVPSLFGY